MTDRLPEDRAEELIGRLLLDAVPARHYETVGALQTLVEECRKLRADSKHFRAELARHNLEEACCDGEEYVKALIDVLTAAEVFVKFNTPGDLHDLIQTIAKARELIPKGE